MRAYASCVNRSQSYTYLADIMTATANLRCCSFRYEIPQMKLKSAWGAEFLIRWTEGMDFSSIKSPKTHKHRYYYTFNNE